MLQSTHAESVTLQSARNALVSWQRSLESNPFDNEALKQVQYWCRLIETLLGTTKESGRVLHRREC